MHQTLKPEMNIDERNTMKKLPVLLFICSLVFSTSSLATEVERILDAPADAAQDAAADVTVDLPGSDAAVVETLPGPTVGTGFWAKASPAGR